MKLKQNEKLIIIDALAAYADRHREDAEIARSDAGDEEEATDAASDADEVQELGERLAKLLSREWAIK